MRGAVEATCTESVCVCECVRACVCVCVCRCVCVCVCVCDMFFVIHHQCQLCTYCVWLMCSCVYRVLYVDVSMSGVSMCVHR